MRTHLRPLPLLFSCAALLTVPFTRAQVAEGTVSIEYAEVLRVEPVHLPAPPPDEAAQCAPVVPLEPAPAPRTDTDSDTNTGPECIPLESSQTQTGPQVLYDVDYVLHGVKYRSRLPYDPGNRLQVQLSVTPILSLPAETPQPPA